MNTKETLRLEALRIALAATNGDRVTTEDVVAKAAAFYAFLSAETAPSE